MATLKFRFELNDKPNREGLCEIFLVITDDGKKQKIKTEVQCKNEHFGVIKDVLSTSGKIIKNKRVLTPEKWITNKDGESTYKNNKLSKLKKKYEDTYDAKKSIDGYVNKESIIKAVENKSILKDVSTVFQRFIDDLEAADNYPTQKGYITAKGHFEGFCFQENKTTQIDFRHIDRSFLIKFEGYLFKNINGDDECSDASVHAVMKRLRRIFNYAIGESIITPDIYPFKTYKLPTVKEKYKQRLNANELALFENEKYEVGTPKFHTQKAFMLALRLAGTRIEDILNLQVKNIINGRITFNMKKGNTEGKLKSVLITDKIQNILNHYVSADSEPDDYILPYLTSKFETLSKSDKKKQIGTWTSYINANLKDIANDACISTHITTHIARHSFASAVQKKTKDVKAIQEALGHSDVKITQRYLDELNVENQDEMMKDLDI